LTDDNHDEIPLTDNHWSTWDDSGSSSSNKSEVSEEAHTTLIIKTDMTQKKNLR